MKRTPEADLERAATDLLALGGWRALKTDPVSDSSCAPKCDSRHPAVRVPRSSHQDVVIPCRGH
jgi:hypothetical protein